MVVASFFKLDAANLDSVGMIAFAGCNYNRQWGKSAYPLAAEAPEIAKTLAKGQVQTGAVSIGSIPVNGVSAPLWHRIFLKPDAYGRRQPA